MSDSESVDISKRSANRIGSAAADGIRGEISDLSGSIKKLRRELSSQLDETNEQVAELQEHIRQLERRVTEIEQQKAAAQREAMEGMVDDLKDQVREKREEYERRRNDVLDDYRSSIRRLKDRFVSSISGNREQFDQVENEFGNVEEKRSATVSAVETVAESVTPNYEERVNAITETRDEFLTTIDEFLEDREKTAETIDSLQTPVPGINGATTVQVPFWVVGVEKNGHEEIRVLPVQNRRSPDDTPTRARPYANHLETHSTHDYSDMTAAVEEYVQRDDVREALAEQGGEFADPDVLRHRDETLDRFVDALERYELGGGTQSEPSLDVTADEANAETGVAADD